jgi:hypothetical protein
MENLISYIIRIFFSQELMTYLPEQSQIIYKSKDNRQEKVFNVLDWLAALCSHIPDQREPRIQEPEFRIKGYPLPPLNFWILTSDSWSLLQGGDNLPAKRRQVIRDSGGDQIPVLYDFLIHIFSAGIHHIVLNGGDAGGRLAL